MSEMSLCMHKGSCDKLLFLFCCLQKSYLFWIFWKIILPVLKGYLLVYISETVCLNLFFFYSRTGHVLFLYVTEVLLGYSSGCFPASVIYRRHLSSVSLISFAGMICFLVSKKQIMSNPQTLP